MGVLDHEEKRRVGRPVCDQPQRRKADQEQVGSVALGNPERRLECASLRVGKEIESVEQWEQQLMKAREGEPRLGQRACRGLHRYTTLQRPFAGGREQGRFADSRLTANDERAAVLVDRIDQGVEPSQLDVSAEKLGGPWISVGASDVHFASSATTLPPRQRASAPLLPRRLAR